MCRLFGLHAGSRPVHATFWLLDAPDSLAEQSRREPDGAGIGTFDYDGGARVSKRPLAAWEDHAFAREARQLSSTTFLAHVRYASTGAHTLVNTHPFEQDGRLFAHTAPSTAWTGWTRACWTSAWRGWCRDRPTANDSSPSSPPRAAALAGT
ncbi:class II glutamine amidotransferase [Paenarthrobacter sp. 22069]|uniref:class II glutamine amidotransferase n=1 Tax=Paenarthrobacter sp. 22069 TaxID=3453864 RepID=UPI003F832F83